MTLKEWLEEAGRSGTWLADQVGVSHQAVYLWLSGKTLPRAVILARIEEITEGRVTARAWAPFDVAQDVEGVEDVAP
jgi:transcriptional regulator with XRE-family HTH domain